MKRKLTSKLIYKSDIPEKLKKIKKTKNEYITESGKIYTYYGNGFYYPKKTFINKQNGYLYVNLNYKKKVKQRRVHILVAEAFIPNPNKYPIVMHKDNNKANPHKSNLKWGTISENTKDAFDNDLCKNDKGFNDSQSYPVCVFNTNQELIKTYGSISIASEKTGITKTGILYQCNHKVKSKPSCGYYFRFLKEYKDKGFVL